MHYCKSCFLLTFDVPLHQDGSLLREEKIKIKMW